MIGFYREWRERLFSPFNVCLWVAATIVATLTGPFGTFDSMTLGSRSVFWSFTISWSMLSAFLVVPLVRNLYPHDNLAIRELLCCSAFTMVFSPGLWVVINLWSGGLAGIGDNTVSLSLVGSASFIIAGVVAFFRALSAPEPRGPFDLPRDFQPPAPADWTPRLFRRLPEIARMPILRLTADDHMVQIHTADRVFEVRMRLSDAVHEMEGVDGFCIHRSHWVARAAIESVIVRNGRTVVIASDGAELPVTRKYAGNLASAGFSPRAA